MCEAELFFKCENFQRTGSFKIRGAANAVFSLSDEEAGRGVATHSSGNHGAALAFAAHLRRIKAYVVMPENAPEVKKDAVANYGAQIIFCKPTIEARKNSCTGVIKRTGATFISSHNDYHVIAGAGTAALELCEKVGDLDVVMAPVGGGGLISGTALAVSAISPKTDIIGVEPKKADFAFRSLKAGKIIPSDYPDTVADGLRMPLGSLTFPIIQRYVKEILTVSEGEIITAMRRTWERMKIIIEASSAVPLAALLAGCIALAGKRIGIIISGGNADLANLPW